MKGFMNSYSRKSHKEWMRIKMYEVINQRLFIIVKYPGGYT